MRNRDGLTNSDHWKTPPEIYDLFDNMYNFDFDPCPLNADFDGLEIDWGEMNFVNPPYNRIDKPKFIDRAIEEYLKGNKVVLLIPAAMGTIHTHKLFDLCPMRVTLKEWRGEYVDLNCIIFPKGRLAFHGYNTKGVYSTKNKGKHDSMIITLVQ